MYSVVPNIFNQHGGNFFSGHVQLSCQSLSLATHEDFATPLRPFIGLAKRLQLARGLPRLLVRLMRETERPPHSLKQSKYRNWCGYLWLHILLVLLAGANFRSNALSVRLRVHQINTKFTRKIKIQVILVRCASSQRVYKVDMRSIIPIESPSHCVHGR